MHGIDNSYDRAGDTDREPRVDVTWVSFCAGAKKESQTAPPQLFPGGILAGLEGLPTSEVHGLCLESFLRQHLLHAVGYLLLL